MRVRDQRSRRSHTSSTRRVIGMSDNEFDVVVVGASIAGCTAATFLGRQGARVALVESHSDPDPYKVMCTHVFQASASPTVRRLGILDDLDEARAPGRAASTSGAATAGSPRAAPTWTRSTRTGSGSTSGARSSTRCCARWRPSTDGVELMMGHTATSLLRDGGRVERGGRALARRRGARAAWQARRRRRRPQVRGREAGRAEDQDRSRTTASSTWPTTGTRRW